MNIDSIPFVKDFSFDKVIEFSNKTFNGYSFPLPGGFAFEPTYLSAGLMVFLVFLLVLTLGSLRHRMAEWSLKGVIPGIGFGFLLAIILEGILIIGGHTILTDTLGWKTAPKPISNALDLGREKLTDVLGENTSVSINEKEANPETVLSDLKSLTPTEYESIRQLICE